MTNRQNVIVALVALLLSAAGVSLLIARPARAAVADQIVWGTCPNLKDFYVNPDETDQRPEATEDGLKFTGKDLIHHATNLALTDVHAGSFVDNGDAGKVVMKYETDKPYTTIVQTPAGMFWSSHISSGPGSQDQPVATPLDLIGIPQRGASGGLTEDTKIISFGVGWWTESGETVVSSITFHGVTYPLTCKQPAPSSSAPSSASPSPSSSTSAANPHHVSPTPSPSYSGKGGALAITGPSGWFAAVLAAGLFLGGGGILFATRARRRRFEA